MIKQTYHATHHSKQKKAKYLFKWLNTKMVFKQHVCVCNICILYIYIYAHPVKRITWENLLESMACRQCNKRFRISSNLALVIAMLSSLQLKTENMKLPCSRASHACHGIAVIMLPSLSSWGLKFTVTQHQEKENCCRKRKTENN